METSARLYTLNYDELKTYLWASVFVVCNMVLPQVFHLIPQGGIILVFWQQWHLQLSTILFLVFLHGESSK